MADIYTPILFCCAAVLLFGKELPSFRKGFIYILFFLSVMMHSSHVLTIVIFTFILTCFYLIWFRKKINIAAANIRAYIITLALAFIFIPTIHFIFTQEFYLSKSSQTFFVAHIADNGLLDKFLEERCPEKEYSLCAYKGTFNNSQSFLWDLQNSPLYKHGDLFDAWENRRQEYSELMKDFLSRPKYVFLFLIDSFLTTFSQLVTFDMVNDNERRPWIEQMIKDHFHRDWYKYNNCLQVKGWYYNAFDKNITDRNYTTMCITSILLILICIINRKQSVLSDKQQFMIVFFVIAIFVNNLVCSTFSVVAPRFQERICWLLPFALLLIIVDKAPPVFNRFFATKKEI